MMECKDEFQKFESCKKGELEASQFFRKILFSQKTTKKEFNQS